ALLVPFASVARARPSSLPSVRRGGTSARVAAGGRAAPRPARIPLRAGAWQPGGPRAPSVARARRPDAALVARARRRRVLRDVLLRLGHALLPRQARLGSRRPHAHAGGAEPLLALARVGARDSPAAADRDGRRPRGTAAARNTDGDRMRWQAVRAPSRCRRDSAAPSLRRERLAQHAGQPGARRARRGPRPRRARPDSDRRVVWRNDGGDPQPQDVRAPARLPEAVQALARGFGPAR